MAKGERAYRIRLTTRVSWAIVAEELGFATHRGAMTSAQTYAEQNNLPWPLIGLTKGHAMYKARKFGMSWSLIANRYGQTINQVKRLAYKHARRHNKVWPPQLLKEKQ